MIPVPNGAKVWLALGHTDMRRGTRTRTTRRDFDPGLPREQVVIPALDLCPCCGSADLSHLPPDITETLEKVPARHKMTRR
jgi:transposase